MTLWTEVNQDATTVDQRDAALGPRVGFLDNFAASWDAQTRASAAFGIEESFREEEAQQIRTLRDAGVESIPSLAPYAHGTFSDYSIGPVYGTKNYLDISRFYARGGDPNVASYLDDYDKRIGDLQKKFPNLKLKTSRDMFDSVVLGAQEAERKMQEQRTTTWGDIGGFLGGAIASFNPRTDPLNFATTPVGGVGKTAALRIATQVGAQGVIEGINQFTGVQEERDILGLSHGFGDAFSRVAGTAVGAGVLQGAGEAIAYGGKRWFRNTATDPAPVAPAKPDLEVRDIAPVAEPRPVEDAPWGGQSAWEADVKAYQEQNVRDLISGARPYSEELQVMSPLSNTRMGRARTAMELDYVTSKLEAWDGEEPHLIPPRTSTALPRIVNDVTMPEVKIDIHSPGKTLDEMARSVDPQMFRVYDDLAQRVSTYRRWLQDMQPQGAASREKLQAQIDDLDNKMQNLNYNMAKVGSRRRGEMQLKMDGLKTERQKLFDDMKSFDTPDMARVRNELISDDVKMRDMGPLVARAYAAAQKQWDLGAADREAVWQMIKDAKTEIKQNAAKDLFKDADLTLAGMNKTLVDRAPILQSAPKVEAQMKAGADAADYATAIVRENMKILDGALDQYRNSIDALIKQDKNGKVEINGQEYKLDLDADKVAIPHEEGTGGKMVSIRQLLEDNAETEADLKAVSVCSTR